jgi:hypothetical protein
VLLKALRAAAGDLDHPHDGDAGVSAETLAAGQPETPAAGQPATVTSASLADALLVIAEAFLATKVAAADDPELFRPRKWIVEPSDWGDWLRRQCDEHAPA